MVITNIHWRLFDGMWNKSKEMSFMELWYTAATYLSKLDLYSPLFVCNSLLQSNPWHWKFEMLYKLICIKNISNNETLSNILEIVIKYLNQINNFLGSLKQGITLQIFQFYWRISQIKFQKPNRTSHSSYPAKLRVCVYYECRVYLVIQLLWLLCFDLILFKTETWPLSMRIQPRFWAEY